MLYVDQVNDIVHVLPTNEPDVLQFIFATDETGFRHLYLYTVRLAVPNGKIMTNEGNMNLFDEH